MSHLSRKLTCLLSLFLLATLPAVAYGQKPQTVLDYYLLLPQKYLRHAGGDSAAARQSAVYIRDVERDYLQAREPNGEKYTALALFKSDDGNHLIAVENRECQRGCKEEFFLLRYQDEQWVDVTGQMMPAVDTSDLRARLAKQFDGKFEPRVLHQLSAGGKVIDVIEYWSGLTLGQLEWSGRAFTFKPLAAEKSAESGSVLASVSNAAGDRLQIIEVTPGSPARLPLQGHLNVKIAYELKSSLRARIFVVPVAGEQFMRDSFTSASVLHDRGQGVTTGYVGFLNQARLNQVEVTMLDEKRTELLSLTYNLDAAWEGTLECPTFRISCFPNRNSPGAPIGCHILPSGLQPNQRLTYNWTITGGVLINGQGTRRINLNPTPETAERGWKVTVQVTGLPSKCEAIVTAGGPAGAIKE
ncbi:MAG TPA: hypothetical protein VF528_13805 [Pyrinomonadaceae bacterium]|jgi:hypothetical protein